MIKIQGTNQSGKTFTYNGKEYSWRYATELSGDPDRVLIEVMDGDSCVFTISAEIVVDSDELTLIVEAGD